MQQAERINPFFQWRFYADTNTAIASARPEATGKTIASGTDKSVPYMVRCKTQQRTYVTRSTYGFLHCPEPGHRRYMYP